MKLPNPPLLLNPPLLPKKQKTINLKEKSITTKVMKSHLVIIVTITPNLLKKGIVVKRTIARNMLMNRERKQITRIKRVIATNIMKKGKAVEVMVLNLGN